MTAAYRVSPEAKADLALFRSYYLTEGGEPLVHRFEHVLGQAFETIADFPRSWPVIADNFRRAVLPVFALNVFYGIEQDEVIIFAVEHGRRDPSAVLEHLQAAHNDA
jgi:plasmid stabilization system protein ParE